MECLAGMQAGGREQHTCMHDRSILADLDLKLDAGRVLQPISRPKPDFRAGKFLTLTYVRPSLVLQK